MATDVQNIGGGTVLPAPSAATAVPDNPINIPLMNSMTTSYMTDPVTILE